jgi:hypothetical protein
MTRPRIVAKTSFVGQKQRRHCTFLSPQQILARATGMAASGTSAATATRKAVSH